MGGQFPPEWGWSVCSGKRPKKTLFRGGQFAPESGGQFDRILQFAFEEPIIKYDQLIPLSVDFNMAIESPLGPGYE